MLCQVAPEIYSSELDKKSAYLKTALGVDKLEVFESPTSHFRQRAEFRIWHTPEKMFYAMFEPGSKIPVEIQNCPMAAEPIANLMQPLLAEIAQDEVLTKSLFEIDFLSSLSGEMLVTLIYRKKLDEDLFRAAAEKLKQKLPITHILGRSRKQKVVIDEDFIIEKLTTDSKSWKFKQIENSFTQPNAQVAQKMLYWARQQLKSSSKKGDLLELYCGNGNFSIALADLCNQVLATELAKSSIKAAEFNLELNQIDNISLGRLAADEVARALDGEKFNRLAHIDLAEFNFQTLLVDPPRAGLDEVTLNLATRFDNLIYISCNPETLARDLEVLKKTHNLINSALFDQFPYTDHIEAGAFLQRKP